jgi:Tfp pilus assembly protein PilF
LFADEKYWEAIQQLEPMVRRAEGSTRSRAKILLARAYRKNPKWRKRAEGVLQSLLEEDPRDVVAYLLLAEIYRDAGLTARARALYRKILEIQPGYAAARRALDILKSPAE